MRWGCFGCHLLSKYTFKTSPEKPLLEKSGLPTPANERQSQVFKKFESTYRYLASDTHPLIRTDPASRPHAPEPPGTYLWEPGVAFCTAELKKASLKKSREPLKMTRALFLACSPAIRRVFFPTAWGYWEQTGCHPGEPGQETSH